MSLSISSLCFSTLWLTCTLCVQCKRLQQWLSTNLTDRRLVAFTNPWSMVVLSLTGQWHQLITCPTIHTHDVITSTHWTRCFIHYTKSMAVARGGAWVRTHLPAGQGVPLSARSVESSATENGCWEYRSYLSQYCHYVIIIWFYFTLPRWWNAYYVIN